MSPHGAVARVVRAAPAGEGELLREVIDGLRESRRRLDPKYFYDERGSKLFDRICRQPEYYLPRLETSILKARLPAFARGFGYHARVIEPGSGSSAKTRILLDALLAPATYVPVDISATHLDRAAQALRKRYPALQVLPVVADFTQPFDLPAGDRPFDRTLVFFPGSTIGNLEPKDAVRLLAAMGRMAGRYGAVVVGADLKKDPRVLEKAYNDAAGLTAQFNLNILAHLNERFAADFDLGSFSHFAFWNPRAGRIEMHLVSTREQTVSIGGTRIFINRDESIWTESCHKYEPAQFKTMARQASLKVDDVWTDPEKQFSVQILSCA